MYYVPSITVAVATPDPRVTTSEVRCESGIIHYSYEQDQELNTQFDAYCYNDTMVRVCV